jgi:hypothetical protein
MYACKWNRDKGDKKIRKTEIGSHGGSTNRPLGVLIWVCTGRIAWMKSSPFYIHLNPVGLMGPCH